MTAPAPAPPADTDELLAIGRRAGLAAVGVAPAVVQEPARTVLQLRKRAGRAGAMQFTYRNPVRSTDPATVLPGARSIIAGAWSYGPLRPPGGGARPDGPRRPRGAVARYSWHDHYADLGRALGAIADALVGRGHQARVVADSNALVDRNAAWAAGLGWYGKNSNLLLPGAGSWFVLGAVVTDAELTPTGPPLDDGCGPCQRCIVDCPTGAIVAPGVVDATRCLAWIVQAGGEIPRQYREAVGDRLYGCDDCQDVCPPNVVADTGARRSTGTATGDGDGDGPIAGIDDASVDLAWLLTATDEAILQRHGRWYIADRDVDVLRRTALVILGNCAEAGDPLVERLLRRHLAHPRPLLRAHAVWAARRLGRPDLLAAVVDDPDPLVAAELAAEVTPRFPAPAGS